MSFGFSITDITALIQLTTRTYQGWKRACGEYADITGELNNLHIILSRVGDEFKALTSLLLHRDQDRNQLKNIASNCQQVVVQLKAIVLEYDGIAESRRSNWDRIRFGQKNLGGIREKLVSQVSALGAYLSVLNVSAIGRMDNKIDGLTGKVTVGFAAANRIGRRRDSIMTTYTGDEKQVWRQFRRELISEGFSSANLKKTSGQLHECVRNMAEAGLLDKGVPKKSDVVMKECNGLRFAGYKDEHSIIDCPPIGVFNPLQLAVETGHSSPKLLDPHTKANTGRGNTSQGQQKASDTDERSRTLPNKLSDSPRKPRSHINPLQKPDFGYHSNKLKGIREASPRVGQSNDQSMLRTTRLEAKECNEAVQDKPQIDKMYPFWGEYPKNEWKFVEQMRMDMQIQRQIQREGGDGKGGTSWGSNLEYADDSSGASLEVIVLPRRYRKLEKASKPTSDSVPSLTEKFSSTLANNDGTCERTLPLSVASMRHAASPSSLSRSNVFELDPDTEPAHMGIPAKSSPPSKTCVAHTKGRPKPSEEKNSSFK